MLDHGLRGDGRNYPQIQASLAAPPFGVYERAMKISGPGSIQPGAIKKAGKGKATSTTRFSSQIGGDDAVVSAASVGGAAPLAAIDGLLSIQEAETATDSRSKGLQRGHELLDMLEGVRRAILLGAIPISQLQQLAHNARNQRETTRDPQLDELLRDIELRAEVELAKFGY